ncbi:MAG: ATP synthase F1 subunit gamma [Phycisphaerae bacterium]|nr:ATP synthase F1 subunit gamma [Phycisphaerae bacterium]
MAKTREIRKRIKAVGNIRRITKTMQMIANSKFAKAQNVAKATKPYTETLFEVLSQLAAGLGEVNHPLLDTGDQGQRPGKPLTLVITADRGMCGAYNSNVLRAAMEAFKENPALRAGEVECVGRKGQNFFKYQGVAVGRQHTQFGDKPTYENVKALAETYIERFLKGEISSVRVASMKFISMGKQAPAVVQLLPFKPEARDSAGTEAGAQAIYEFSPSAKELLDDILPAGVKAVLFQAFNDAVVSEHIARMVAMKAATDNAGKAGKRYTLVYNRARQAQITTELTEIISGAAALA